MKIKRMRATFGRLEQAELTLTDGLNIIHFPNEGGKSTWCGFLRAMLYGIPTRDRDKKGSLADKNRYQPWSGAPMEGELDLIWQGQEITLRRAQKGNVPFGEFSAVYTGTGQPIPELTAQNCGELLLGVGREMWERSAFIGHAPTLAIDGTPELERRIAALLTSGQEDVSFSETEARLRQWQRRRQHNKSGLIPRTEEDLAAVEQTLSRISLSRQRLELAENEQRRLEEEVSALEAEAAAHQALAQAELNARYTQACSENELAQAALRSAEQQATAPLPSREELLAAQNQLHTIRTLDRELEILSSDTEQAQVIALQAQQDAQDDRFHGMTDLRATAQAQSDRERAEHLLGLARRVGRMMPIGAAVGAAAGAILAAFSLPAGIAAGVAAIATSVILCHRTASRARRGVEDIFSRYRVDDPAGISAAAEEFCCRHAAAAQAAEDLRRLQTELQRRRGRRDTEQTELFAFVGSFAPDAVSLSLCADALTRALSIEQELTRCRERAALTASRCEDLRSQGARSDVPSDLPPEPPERTPEQTDDELQRARGTLSVARSQMALTQGELLTLGDQAELEARRDELTGELARRRREFQALETALAALQQANATLQARFAPELNRLAGQLLSQLTAGRYDALCVDREFEASAHSTDTLLPHSWLALSRGTADQIYLAVRLAVCLLCLPEDDPSPLVLDDALITFDDERMALALQLLSRLDRQVLLFSCQQREALQGLGTVLPLQS